MAWLASLGDAVHFEDCSALVATLATIVMSLVFVILLDAVSSKPRNHPETVVRRLVVALVVMPTLSTLCLWSLASSTEHRQAMPLLGWLGIRTDNIGWAIFVPFLLVTIGYGGEYLHRILDGESFLYFTESWDRYGFRNYIAAPLAEEYIFRACFLPLLLPHWSITTCIFVSPAIFGIAHLNLAWEEYRQGEPVPRLLLAALLRIAYTTLFGSFSSYLFLRTGHFVSCFFSHVYCNILSLPNFGEIPGHRYQIVIIAAHLLSMVSFFYLLSPISSLAYTDSQFAHYF